MFPALHPTLKKIFEEFAEPRPCQTKSVQAGLLKGENVLVCTPTASGKTLVAEIACMQAILNSKGKAIYIVPLKALANEKYKDFGKKYGNLCNIGLAIGDLDKSDKHISNYDFIITTSEKLDSLMRHKIEWLNQISVVVIDEIHLLNDSSRGPTLEIVLTLLKDLNVQIVALSATIGNPEELSEWLKAKLVIDTWRPVELKKGIYFNENLEFY